MDNFDLQKYLKLIEDGNIETALNYRAICIPDYVYKFYPLGNLNDERTFLTLKNDNLWFALPDAQNDPFEFKGMYLDKKRLLDAGLSINAIECFEKKMREMPMCCFVEDMFNNFPMWAHYANNHQGFCVKYKVEDKRVIRNVIYEPKRIPIYKLLIDWMNEIEKFENGKNTSKSKIDALSMILCENLFIKHESWKSEKEYRIAYPTDIINSKNGSYVTVKDAGLKTEEIICGFKCSDENRDKLERIAKKLNVQCRRCRLSDTEYAVYV